VATSKKNPNESQTWLLIREKLRALIEPTEFEEWIVPLTATQINDSEVFLHAPNMVFCQGIIDGYWDRIEHAKAQLGIDSVLIRIEVESSSEPRSRTTKLNEELGNDEVFAEQNNIAVSRALSDRCNLNPTYTFEAFVRGESNQFAHATCMAVADAPGQTYNPLFIYGSTGLGKTHLLHAVGARVLQRNRNAAITYITSERFMNEMIYCLRFNKMWDFRNKYRNCDVFLVDDIQFISGKERTQEEFFHTFNTLYESKKQIVITSDLFPQDIPDIEDRLRNRFQWGLIADIQPPSVEHRTAILINKATQLGIFINDDVALYIANHAKRNVRELEGALHRIAAFAALQGRPIDLELAAETFQNVLGESPKRLTIEMIQKTVADHFKVRVTDLKSKKRQRALTVPRQIAMYLSRSRTKSSYPEIGTKFGGKDHTTVMHAVKKIELELNSDLDLKTSVEALERKLEQQC
jgi:chromosomal replication initiator protein